MDSLTNARKEWERMFSSSEVLCAVIGYSPYYSPMIHPPEMDNRQPKEFHLPLNYTSDDYQEFLQKLDFDYDAGYGTQELCGTVWLKNNKWATRAEYDGSEWWQVHEVPEIPQQCHSVSEDK